MCRIFGHFGEADVTNELLRQVSHLQIHGGPDSQRFIRGAGWSLGNNRLAIQGLDQGEQPFYFNAQIMVVFNGEIYNHEALRTLLQGRGYHIPGSCDGTILPAMYREYGEQFVRYLDGMFAIAVIDLRNTPRLFLASDPAGQKSLYYSFNPALQTLFFASEIPALLRFPGVGRAIRPEAIDDYLSMRAICGEQTIFRTIQTLVPAQLLYLEQGKDPVVKSYQSFLRAPAIDGDMVEAAKSLDQLLSQEVTSLTQADAPVCLVISGGLDSSYIAALARDQIARPESFHICYRGVREADERMFAREVAHDLGINHHEIELDPQTFPDLITAMVPHLGQPNAAPHCLSTFALFKAIRSSGYKVALTGEGADEYFGGYARFLLGEQDNARALSNYLGKMSLFDPSLKQGLYRAEFQHLLRENYSVARGLQSKLAAIPAGEQRVKAMLEFDQQERFPYYILRRVDHLSMAHGVETRAPFCQPRVMDFAARLPMEYKIHNQMTKRVVYQAAQTKIPTSVLQRQKQPFTLPITTLLSTKGPLFDFFSDVLHSDYFSGLNFFEPTHVRKLLNQQLEYPDHNALHLLWALVIYCLWEQYITQELICPKGGTGEWN